MTETASLADVVLPARGAAERDGSFTSIERRVQAFDVGVLAPPLALADWMIITAIAGQLGADWPYASADGVMAEITQTIPLYAEMSFANLTAPIPLARKTAHYIYSGMSFTAEAREGLQWRTLAEDETTTFALNFVAPTVEPENAGLILVAPRVIYDGGVLINQADVVAAHIQKPHAAFSGEDAKRLGLVEGEMITLTANGVSQTLPVRINRRIPKGVVLTPRNLAGAPAERLLNGNRLFVPVEVAKVPVAEPA
jgi:predicted molibdopterin-dependent oxidoreductase YjgC